MSEILDHLNKDHENMQRLLGVLEDECSRLTTYPNYDYKILSNIIEYFNHYPTKYHHPLEDKLFAWMATERPHLAPVVENLRIEHENQEKLGAQLAKLIKDIQAGHEVSQSMLINKLSTYVEFQREHINKEEQSILREAKGFLHGMHLAEAPIPDRLALDPLFGDDIDAAYSDLAVVIGRGGDRLPSC